MPELADLPAGWGLRPVLFRLGPVAIPSYEVFVTLGLVAGLLLLLFLTNARERNQRNSPLIVGAALVGGALGAKLLELAFLPTQTLRHLGGVQALLSGRTILGGFLGGSLAVVAVKRMLGIRERRGNDLAPAIALGLALGRVGCLLRGCCYGTPTGLPWGVDFGDSHNRHPTQAYEILFALLALVVLLAYRRRPVPPGRLMTAFMVTYLVFRFGEEFLRAGERVALGLTVYQFAALVGLAWFALKDRLLPAAPAGAP